MRKSVNDVRRELYVLSCCGLGGNAAMATAGFHVQGGRRFGIR